MRNGTNFGWSYPPGAANDPYAPYNEEDPPCAVCGRLVDKCICQECQVCGEYGNLACYYDSKRKTKKKGHGLRLTLEQVVERQRQTVLHLQLKVQDAQMLLDHLESEDEIEGTFSDDLAHSPNPWSA